MEDQVGTSKYIIGFGHYNNIILFFHTTLSGAWLFTKLGLYLHIQTYEYA